VSGTEWFLSSRVDRRTLMKGVSRSSLDERNHSVPDTKTPAASPREAQSSGAQCDGGLASRSGLKSASDIAPIIGLLVVNTLFNR